MLQAHCHITPEKNWKHVIGLLLILIQHPSLVIYTVNSDVIKLQIYYAFNIYIAEQNISIIP